MAKVDLSLLSPLEGTLLEGPVPEEVAVPRAGCSELKNPGDKVIIGEKIAAADSPDGCDIHSPVQGTVLSMDENEIRIINEGGEQTVEKRDLTRFEGPGLLEALRLMGAQTGRLSSAQTLIINGVNPEPGVTINQRLATEQHKTLRKGTAVLQKALRPAETLFAVPKGGGLALLGNSFTWIDPVHPAGMPPLVAKTATGKENPYETAVIPLHTVRQIGRIAETGLPVLDTPLTAAGRDCTAMIGTQVGDLLAHFNEAPEQGDRVILGGPMTGMPAYSVKQGIGRDTTGVTRIPADRLRHEELRPCIGCGECIAVCPARLRPDLIASYAEFSLFERAGEYAAEVCFECGLCALHCPALRPLLQYIVLAKRELEYARKQA